MNNWLDRLVVLFGALPLMIAGCQGNPVNDPTYQFHNAATYPHARKPEYIWGFSNASKEYLHGVGVKWKGGVAAAGELPPSGPSGGGATDNEGWEPMPERVTLHWSNSDKVRHEKTVEVATALPDAATFTGTIWFKYLPDGTWVMVPISKEEQMRRSKAHLSMP
jgi:hypothetical protein